MLANTQTCAVIGLDGYVVQVEVDISPGLPVFNIVGLPDAAVQEAKERVRAALRNSGCEFPLRRITVNLAPADLKKEGPAYDLPIAVCMLLSSGQIDTVPAGAVFLGELSLEGVLRHTKGILAMVSVARDQGYTSVFVPTADAHLSQRRRIQLRLPDGESRRCPAGQLDFQNHALPTTSEANLVPDDHVDAASADRLHSELRGADCRYGTTDG